MVEEVKIALSLGSCFLAFGAFIWARTRQREEVKEKAAQLMHGIVDLSYEYLAIVDEAKAVLEERAKRLSPAEDAESSAWVSVQSTQLEIWRKLASFQLQEGGAKLLLYGTENRKVNELLEVHKTTLVALERARDLIALPNIAYLRWTKKAAQQGPNMTGG